MRSTQPSLRLRAALAPAMLLALLLCTHAVRAQGTQGTLPDPITTGELMRYADRLGLSEEQRRAAERVHDDYREKFRALRDGEIAQFLAGMRGLQGRMPQRAAFEDFMKRWERLYGRIAQLDDQMFFNLQEILTEQQMLLLPRARMLRERTRCSGSMEMMMIEGPPVDLSEVIAQLDMHPAERQAIDPALAAYEHRLTDAMRDLHRAGNRMFIDMFDAFEAAGITQETMEDPEQMGRMMEVMQEVMRDLMSGFVERGREMRRMNERAYESMRHLVSPPTARALRNRYYSQAYSSASFALRLPVEARIATAMSLDQISDRLRESIAALESETRLKLDRILADAVDLHKTQEGAASPFGMDDDFDWTGHHEKLSELQKAARDLEEETQRRLLAMLAAELDQPTQEKVNAAELAPIEQVRSRSGGMSAVVTHGPDPDDEPAPARLRQDDYLPAAISQREVTIYARLLRLDDYRRAIVDELHQTYLERFERLTDSHFQPLADARGNLWRHDPEAGHSELDLGVLDRITDLRKKALTAIRAADAAFFSDISAAVLEADERPRLERVRYVRDREVFRTRQSFMGPNANALARVDVSRLVRLQSLPAEELARIDAILVEYDRAAAELARKYFDAEVKMNDVQQRWSWELSRTSREGRQMERAMQYQEAMREPQRALGQVARQVADLNETTIEQLLSNVSPSYSESLFAAYNRRAFPTVYRDASSVNDHLLSAMRLPDLTESQRSQLAELLAEYRPTYAAMTDDMVVIARELGPGFSWAALDQDDWSRIANVQERMAKVRFERNELNSRAITQIKSILNDTQLAQLTPLPQPVEHASSAWDF